MPTEVFRVVSYYKINGAIESVSTVYRGNYERCLKFYIDNKDYYRKRNKFLELMLN